jgi:hypothetical protein
MIKSWDDISLDIYIELLDILEGDYTELDIISLILDISVEEVENMPYDDMVKKIGGLDFLNKTIPQKNIGNIVIDKTQFYPIPFNDLEFGAFIDIEHYMSDAKNYRYNINKIVNILFRRLIKPADALNKAIYEPYDNWSDTRYQMYNKVPVTSVYNVLNNYIEWRKNIFEKYQGLFGDGEGMSEEEEKEMLRDMTGAERREYLNSKNVGKWGWVLFLFKLADRNPIKILEAAKMNVVMALNILSMFEELKIDQATMK